MTTSIRFSTVRVLDEIVIARENAHKKHGDMSIESVQNNDRFNSILVEEVGEVSKAINEFHLGNTKAIQTNDDIRSELIDVATVAIAWISMLDEYKRETFGD